MDIKQVNLTNEKLKERFTVSQFDLVSYAIKLAENMIRSGRAPRVKTDKQNIAMLILEEIAQGKDYLEPIQEVPETPVQPETTNIKHQKFTDFTASKNTEKKKPRKILAE